MSSLKVRSAEMVDTEAITSLLNDLGYPAPVAEVAERLRWIDVSSVDYVIVALVDGAVAGVASLNVAPQFAEGGTFARITSLVVDAPHRRAGVGRALIDHAERLAQDAGCTVVEVSSGRRPEREAAHRFYRGLGYADTGGRHILYEKHLPRGSL